MTTHDNDNTPPADSDSRQGTEYAVALDNLPFVLVPLNIALLLVPLALFALVHPQSSFNSFLSLWLIPGLVVGVLLHEAVHAIFWKVSSGLAWSQFTFGFKWEALAPYCHAKAPMPLRPYRIGALAPAVLTGLLPWLVALWIDSAPLALLGAVLISAAIGDFYVLWLLRDVPAEADVRDHPEKAGGIVYLPDSSA
jgi:hypothetical protein